MAYKQLVTPNINIGATAGYCLGYVDDALSAPASRRSYSAQIAYNTATSNGWVRNNQNYPVNVWFVMFWSIDNSAAKGLGHVALAYCNGSSLQIHDSEVHRGARNPYGSLSELAKWFGSVGTQLTYLGWSVGVDGVVLLQEETNSNSAASKIIEKIGGKTNMILFQEGSKVYLWVGNQYTHIGDISELDSIKTMMAKAGYDTWIHSAAKQIKYIKKLATEAK